MVETPSQGASFRSLAPGRFRPTPEEVKEGWESALVSVDASVLLSLYRYSADTHDELLGLLAKFSGRIWVTHQAATEYEANRMSVIQQQVYAYEDTLKKVQKSVAGLVGEFRALRRHPLLDEQLLVSKVEGFADDVKSIVSETQARHGPALTADDFLADPTRDRLEVLLTGRVGQKPGDDQLRQWHAEGRERIEEQLPPGYRDKDKPEPGRYGDYVFWRESVGRACEEERALLLITDDEKDDWWWVFDGLTLGPRPELVQEFASVSGGRRLHMYTTLGFLHASREIIGEKVSDEAVEEVDKLSKARIARVERRTLCPHCGAEVLFTIGAEWGHTALPVCQDCGESFHAFHTREGGIGVRKPGGRVWAQVAAGRDRVHVICPSCKAEFRTFPPALGAVLRRACLGCGESLVIDGGGVATSEGAAEQYDVAEAEDTCPRCGRRPLAFVYTRGDEERTSCPACGALVIRRSGGGSGEAVPPRNVSTKHDSMATRLPVRDSDTGDPRSEVAGRGPLADAH